MRNLSSPQGSRRQLPHLMSISHNGSHNPRESNMFTRMTNEQGQSIDIYENPSEHYSGMNFLPPHLGNNSPFVIRNEISPIKKHDDAKMFGKFYQRLIF